MSWIVASLVSAFFLGCYDLATKHAVRGNAVLPVLFLANFCSALVWVSLLTTAAIAPGLLPASLAVPPLSLTQHAQLLVKALIIAASYTCTYFALKHLPVSIASPIRASGPIWTMLGAVLFLAERPTLLQLAGIVLTIGSFLGLSLVGRADGIHFQRNRWIGWILAGTLFGSLSGLYDRYLLGRAGFAAATVQSWYCIYLAAALLPLALGWKLRQWSRHGFQWRWSIPLASFALLACDFVYFSALRDPDALVAIVASLRRASILVAFLGGIVIFGEGNARQKLPAIIGVIAGLVLTIVGG